MNAGGFGGKSVAQLKRMNGKRFDDEEDREENSNGFNDGYEFGSRFDDRRRDMAMDENDDDDDDKEEEEEDLTNGSSRYGEGGGSVSGVGRRPSESGSDAALALADDGPLAGEADGVWQPLRRSRVVLQVLLADPYIAPFTAAVDVAAFPDYLKIVDQPMDLGTVMDKLYK